MANHELSNPFNDNFSSIGPKLANNIHANEDNSSYLENLAETGHCTLELKPNSLSKVLPLLSRLCKSKSTGLDKITAKILRECADLIAESLCTIFNQSIVSEKFPDKWKLLKVVPLFKHGNRWELNNYHPISVIPVV